MVGRERKGKPSPPIQTPASSVPSTCSSPLQTLQGFSNSELRNATLSKLVGSSSNSHDDAWPLDYPPLARTRTGQSVRRLFLSRQPPPRSLLQLIPVLSRSARRCLLALTESADLPQTRVLNCTGREAAKSKVKEEEKI